MRLETPCVSVSVVIPAFNGAWCIDEALESVANQTYRDFEIIVVNDRSNDNTAQVVEGFGRRYPHIKLSLIEGPGKGIGASRNAGIRVSRGKYIAFLDQDDLWFLDKLKECVHVLENRLDIGLICHAQKLRRSNQWLGNSWSPIDSNNTHRYLLFHGNRVSTSTVVVRRPLLESVGLFSEERDIDTAEDFDLWLRLAKLTQFCTLPMPLGVARLSFNTARQGNFEKYARHALCGLRVMYRHYFKREPKIKGDLFRLFYSMFNFLLRWSLYCFLGHSFFAVWQRFRGGLENKRWPARGAVG